MERSDIKAYEHLTKAMEEAFCQPQAQMCCPICQNTGVHVMEQVKYIKGKAEWYLTLYFCECDHQWVTYLYEYKGELCYGTWLLDDSSIRDIFQKCHEGGTVNEK